MKYVYEAIGTFFLAFTIGMVVIEPNAAPPGFAPLAIGTVLAVMIFAGGHLSGGHYNPAVSLAVYIRGKIALNDMLIYWVVQIVAAIVAGLMVVTLKGSMATLAGVEMSVTAVDLNSILFGALLAEFIGTFALTYTVLNVATARATDGNSYYGWAIGMAVAAMAYAVGPITGGAFNPAVAFGITVMGLATWASIWVFVVAELLAAVVAAFVFKAAHPNDDKVVEQPKPTTKSSKR